MVGYRELLRGRHPLQKLTGFAARASTPRLCSARCYISEKDTEKIDA